MGGVGFFAIFKSDIKRRGLSKGVRKNFPEFFCEKDTGRKEGLNERL